MSTVTTAPVSGTARTSSVAAIGNHTLPTATKTSTTIYTGGAGAKLRTGFGGAVIASAVAFALLLAV